MLGEVGVIALFIGLAFVASFVISSGIAARDGTKWSYSKTLNAIRKYLKELFDSYYGRFRVRGLTEKTLKYSLSLAFLLWIDAFLLLTLLPLGGFKAVLLVSLAALAIVLTMSVLGFNARGKSDPSIFRFGIFYEPTMALMSTFLIGKLPDLASRGAAKLFGLML